MWLALPWLLLWQRQKAELRRVSIRGIAARNTIPRTSRQQNMTTKWNDGHRKVTIERDMGVTRQFRAYKVWGAESWGTGWAELVAWSTGLSTWVKDMEESNLLSQHPLPVSMTTLQSLLGLQVSLSLSLSLSISISLSFLSHLSSFFSLSPLSSSLPSLDDKTSSLLISNCLKMY